MAEPARKVYLDYAATTPTRKEVVDAMLPYFGGVFGNPSSIHNFGQEARNAVEKSRGTVARLLDCEPEEVIFTAGGSESDNLAIKGRALEKGRGHLITSAIEHHAVLETAESFRKLGFELTVLPVDSEGLVDPADVRKAIRKDTILITVMHANNEVGVIEPIEEIAAIAREAKVPFHTDAVQTAGHLPISFKRLGADMLSLSAHKFHGPKGIGVLLKKRGLRVKPWLTGGGQERGLRAGTHNVPGIVGLARALELAVQEQGAENARLTAERDRFINTVLTGIPDTRLNGHPTKRLPNNISFCVRFIEGESLLLALAFRGLAVSTGSACTSESLEPSHVLLALGIPKEEAHGSVRITTGRETTREDLDYAFTALKESAAKLRSMSPLYADHIKKASLPR